jgi:deoxyribose-phosphate aldolase
VIWQEGRERKKRNMKGELILETPVLEMINNNEISRDEIRAVISQAETTGAKFIHTGTGRFIASRRLGTVTYWVWYSFSNGRCIVHKAYSHRMEIG